MSISRNDMLMINDIIYKIHTIRNLDEMRVAFLDDLNLLIPSEISTFFLSNSTSEHNNYNLSNPLGLGVSAEFLDEYVKKNQSLDYTRWTFANPIAKVYRETDLVPDKIRRNFPFYKQLYATSGVHYAAFMTLIYNGIFLGVYTAYRSKEAGNFLTDEIFLMEMIVPHLSYRLYLHDNGLRKNNFLPSLEHLNRHYQITAREWEIINLLFSGEKRIEIAHLLCISINTVNKHIQNIYQKFEVNNLNELLYNIYSLPQL